MRGLTIAMFLAGCGAENSGTPDAIVVLAPDAAPYAFTWEIHVTPSDAVVRIDGVERDSYTLLLESEEVAAAREVLVEAEVGGVVASTRTLRGDCDAHCAPVDWDSRVEVLCSYDSGELRYDFVNCEGSGGCAGDAFCWPNCRRDDCPENLRCGLDRLDADPAHGWLSCVAIGAAAEGDTCAIDAQGVDDCGDLLHCVGGVCRRACEFEQFGPDYFDQGHCGVGVACEPVPGMSPEVGVCPP